MFKTFSRTYTKTCMKGYKKGKATRMIEKLTILWALTFFRKPLMVIARPQTKPGKATKTKVMIPQP